MRYLILTSFLVGCTTYPTLDEACNDKLPGGDAVTSDLDADVLLYMNCHRRQSRLPQTRVNPTLQQAVEGHAVYLEAQTPRLNLVYQEIGKEPFTGQTSEGRAENAGYVPTTGSQLTYLLTTEFGDFANVYTGRDLFDVWFAYPTFRQVFLQNPALGAALANGDYVSEVPEDQGLESLPIHFNWWNINYQRPTAPYAQTPIVVPANGAIDVPARYVHVVNDDVLEIGKTYGYPITFTVGVGETNLEIETAALIGPNGPVSINTIVQDLTYENFVNTAMIVPLDPLTVGAEYTATAVIKTGEGKRTAKSTFSIGSRTIPDFGITEAPQARRSGSAFGGLELQFVQPSLPEHGPIQAL